MSNIIVLLVGIVMAVWVYKVVDRHDGQLPWLWAVGALVFWPLVTTIAGFKYDDLAIKVVGISGLGLFALGIAMAIGLVALL